MLFETTQFYVGTKIVFGKNASKQIGQELENLGSKHVLVVTDKGIVQAGF